VTNKTCVRTYACFISHFSWFSTNRFL